MKPTNILLIIILTTAGLGIGLFVWSHYLMKPISTGQGQHERWYCPMHPWILYDHPGKCPICGMDLVKKEDTAQQSSSGAQSPEGYTTITETVQKQQLIGVRTALVTKREMTKTIRVAGEYEGEVLAQVFEDDVEFIKVGQKAVVEVPAFHKKYEGYVNHIESSIDEISRTSRVHVLLKYTNQLQFKTNMFVNVEFPVKRWEAIVVPNEAVMDTGLRKIVFVCKDGETFEPREIQTGIESDEGYEVIAGLKAGERIVVSGNFLLDSESRIQAGLQGESHG